MNTAPYMDHKAELLAAYRMLQCAIPLALKALQCGGVDAMDQMAFWNSHEEVSEFCEMIDFQTGNGSLECGPGSIIERIETLEGNFDLAVAITGPTDRAK